MIPAGPAVNHYQRRAWRSLGADLTHEQFHIADVDSARSIHPAILADSGGAPGTSKPQVENLRRHVAEP